MSEQKGKQFSEEAKTGASYIAIFYEQINGLTHWLVSYSNLVSFMEEKSGGKIIAESKLGEEDQTQFIHTLNEARFRLGVTHVQFSALKEHLSDKIKIDEEEEKKIEETVKRMKSKFIINVEDLEYYTKSLHKFILQDIVSDLLKTSKELVDELYSDVPQNQ